MSKLNKLIGRYLKVGLVLFCCLIDTQGAIGKQPFYNGKSLSDWLISAQIDEETDAIRHIGTNGLPTLLQILGATPRSMKMLAWELNSQGMREAFRDNDDGVSFEILKGAVVQAFRVLGTNAQPAIPQITKLLEKDNDDISPYAAAALAVVGPNGFAALTNALKTTQSSSVRLDIIAGLDASGEDPSLSEETYIQMLADKSSDVRRIAASHLTSGNPEVIIPILLPMLDDSDPDVRRSAATSISSYGTRAESVLPRMISYYTNNPTSEALGALRNIDESAAETAEQTIVNNNPLNPNRTYYTKTKLKSGLELITGGRVHTQLPSPAEHCLKSAELYDPKTGKWTETGEMNEFRWAHVAILLFNGKVLVAGGYNEANQDLSSAELYDPATGKWTETGSMTKRHAAGGILLMADGKAEIYAGGWYAGNPIQDKEVYDPLTEKWTALPGN